MAIPTVGGHVRIDNVHPVFAARLDAFLADEGFGGLLKVFSGVRTHAHQKELHDGWLAGIPGFNLAADPNAPITPSYHVAIGRGSWHMEQESTTFGRPHGYAVDLDFDPFCWTFFGLEPIGANRVEVRDYIENIAQDHRLARTVPSEE